MLNWRPLKLQLKKSVRPKKAPRNGKEDWFHASKAEESEKHRTGRVCQSRCFLTALHWTLTSFFWSIIHCSLMIWETMLLFEDRAVTPWVHLPCGCASLLRGYRCPSRHLSGSPSLGFSHMVKLCPLYPLTDWGRSSFHEEPACWTAAVYDDKPWNFLPP